MLGWDQTTPLWENLREIKSFIDTEQPESVNIFSFAIQSHEDLDGFGRYVRPQLEEILGVTFNKVPTTSDIIRAVRSTLRLPVLDQHGLFSIFSKQWGFIHAMKSGEHVLFDDMVEDCIFQNADKNLRLISI